MAHKEVRITSVDQLWAVTYALQNLQQRTSSPAPLYEDKFHPSAGFGTSILGLRSPYNTSFESRPLSRLSPQSQPSLCEQRDHSACSSTGSPLTLKIRKTRENLRRDGLVAEVPPPCLHHESPPVATELSVSAMNSPLTIESARSNSRVSSYVDNTAVPPPVSLSRWPIRRRSVSRRMLHRVRDGLSGRSRSQQSTGGEESDTSLIRRLSEKLDEDCNESERRVQSDIISEDPPSYIPDCQSHGSLQVPYIELQLETDREVMTATTAGECVLTAVATVRLKDADTAMSMHATASSDASCKGVAGLNEVAGRITSLRLCYKPSPGCTVVEVTGQKVAKDLVPGQHVSLQIRVHVPAVVMRPSTPDMVLTQDMLTADLESMLGILQTDALAVEAKYRHSLLATDNVTTVRQTCSIHRPQPHCIWSMTTESDTLQATSSVLPVQSVQPTLVVSHADPEPVVQVEAQDLARLVWRNIRRSSASTNLLHIGVGSGLGQTRCSENVQALRQKALANKRSVGAETLMEWQWEEKRLNGEAPWL